jgi:DNA-binding SARP family transcriptional activator
LEVWGADGPVILTGAKRRALAAYLVVRAGEVVSLDRLVEDLWDQRPTPGAPGTVKSYLSGLRKLMFGAAGVRLATLPGGYVLQVPAASVDAARFEGLCAQAAAELDHAARVALVDAALGLWRAAPLEEFAGATWADLEARRLEGLRRVALQHRIQALLDLGRHLDTIPELEGLVVEHGLDERLWAQLMVAYYRAGRQADALRAYRQAHSILAEELGIEPSSDLARLEQDILLQAPELDWRPLGVSEVVAVSVSELPPLPARLALGGVFVGRDDECARLDAALSAVRAGADRRVVLVSGEPGIGKTTLAARFAHAAHEQGSAVLYGRCDEDLGIPYQPWAEALAQLVRHLPRVVLEAHRAARGAQLGQLVPDLAPGLGADQLTSGDPEARRYLLWGATVDLLARTVANLPLVLVLEDLHWADLPTLQLLRYVVSADPPLRLLVVATYRDCDLGGEHPLPTTLAALHREPGVERVTLAGLDRDALGAIVEGAGRELDAVGIALLDVLAAETDGNPFFVTELLRHVTEAVSIAAGGGDRGVGTNAGAVLVPPTVQEVITQRVLRLSEPSRRLLSLASVIGRDFDAELLAAIADCDEPEVLDALDEAACAALVRPVAGDADGYTFVHSLTARAVHDALSPARRRRVHARIAMTLDARGAKSAGQHVGELAHHYLEAGDQPDQAIHCAMRAGALALAKLAPDDALRWYRRALEVLDRTAPLDEARRAALLVGLGEAQRQAGEPSHRQTLLAAADLAQRIHDTDLLVRAVTANSRGYFSQFFGADAERIRILEAARAATEGHPTPARAQVLATLAAELVFADPDRTRRVADEAIALARHLSDDPTLVTVATRLEWAVGAPDTLAQRVSLATEATEAAARTGDPILRLYAAAMGMTPALQIGDMETFRTRVGVVERLACEIGQPFLLWLSAFARFFREQLAGQLHRAEHLATEALDIGVKNGQPDAFLYYVAQIAEIRLYQGRVGELIEADEQHHWALPDVPLVRATRALGYCELGRIAEARRIFEVDAANGFHDVPLDLSWTGVMSMYARLAATLDDRRAAAYLSELLQPWRDQIATVCPGMGSLAHPLGLALATSGRDQEAEDAFAQATAIHEQIGAPLNLASTRLEWARLLARGQRRGDRQRARELAHAAHVVADRLGAAAIERDTYELLASLKAHARAFGR